jgi:putative transposase
MLNRTFGCIRVAWNSTLAWRQARHHGERAPTSYAQASAYLTTLKAEAGLGFLNEVSSVPLQQALRHQQAAFASFFAGRARYPRYKSRGRRQSAEYTRSGLTWRRSTRPL